MSAREPYVSGWTGGERMDQDTRRNLFGITLVLVMVLSLTCAGCVQYPDQSGNFSANNTSSFGNGTNITKVPGNGSVLNTTGNVPGGAGITIPPRTGAAPRTTQQATAASTKNVSKPQEHRFLPDESGNNSGASAKLIPTTNVPAAIVPVTTKVPAGTTPAGSAATPGSLSYVNAANKFSVTYPGNWTKEEVAAARSGIIVKFHTPVVTLCNVRKTDCADYVATLSVSIDPNPTPSNVEEYYNKALGGLQEKYQNHRHDQEFAGTPLRDESLQYQLHHQGCTGQPDKQVMQYYSILYGKAYVLTYSAGSTRSGTRCLACMKRMQGILSQVSSSRNPRRSRGKRC